MLQSMGSQRVGHDWETELTDPHLCQSLTSKCPQDRCNLGCGSIHLLWILPKKPTAVRHQLSIFPAAGEWKKWPLAGIWVEAHNIPCTRLSFYPPPCHSSSFHEPRNSLEYIVTLVGYVNPVSTFPSDQKKENGTEENPNFLLQIQYKLTHGLL